MLPRAVTKTLADLIEDLLPQTQCTKCGYPACRPYAEAIASGEADINQCPPGGIEGVRRLSAVTGRPVIPINPANGLERPRPVAFIDEALCIGCTLCIQACPVDAILGAAKQMHTILPSLCTGCDLCVAPCPVDCISMVAGDGRCHRLGRLVAAGGRCGARAPRFPQRAPAARARGKRCAPGRQGGREDARSHGGSDEYAGRTGREGAQARHHRRRHGARPPARRRA